MAENDVDSSSKDLSSHIHKQITARTRLMSKFGLGWLDEWVFGENLDGTETVIETLEDQLDGSQTYNHSKIYTKQLMLLQVFRADFKEAFLTEQLLRALSAPDQVPIHSTANSKYVLSLDSFPPTSAPESSAQHAPPAQFYTHFHDVQRRVGLTDNLHIHETAYRTMLGLIDELRKRQIFHYLVPEALESSGLNCQIALLISVATNPPPFSPESRVNVIETSASRGAYVALSYRWPPRINESSMLSRNTLENLTQGIPACELLSEIQDACTLAKGVGIQYLWVDAPCIMQGPGGDWHIQAEKMASIYMNAVVTIAAIDQTPLSTAAEERPFVSNQQELPSYHSDSKETNQESIYLWLTKSGNFISRPFGELDKRGWAFQEQLLSSRIISLTKEGVFWDCLHHSASSNRPTGIQGDFSPNFQHSDNRKLKRFLLNPNTFVPREEYYWLWKRAVQSYTIRKLTRESYRLIALEGITRRMSLLLDDECILGIWRKDVLRSLVWFVESPSKVKYWGNKAVLGPSWSWVSVNSPVQYRLWHPYERNVDRRGEIVSKKAMILELSSRRENPLGFDRFSGRLTIVGALMNGYLYDSDVYFARRRKDKHLLDEIVSEGKEVALLSLKKYYAGNNEDRYYIGHAFLDSYQEHQLILSKNKTRTTQPSIKKIQCLLLIEGGYTDLLKAYYCLILQERPDLLTYEFGYQRIGLCAFDTRQICVSSKRICTGDHQGYSDCMGSVRRVEIL